jgi:hypothetical protein
VEGGLEQQDVERIARTALKDLGVSPNDVSIVVMEARPGHFTIDIPSPRGTTRLQIRCGEGSTAQWVRNQILEQYQAQH